MTPTSFSLEAGSHHEAVCLLGALSDYGARLLPFDGRWLVEIDVTRDLNTLLLGAFRATEQCLEENHIARVTFHIGERDYQLAPARSA